MGFFYYGTSSSSFISCSGVAHLYGRALLSYLVELCIFMHYVQSLISKNLPPQVFLNSEGVAVAWFLTSDTECLPPFVPAEHIVGSINSIMLPAFRRNASCKNEAQNIPTERKCKPVNLDLPTNCSDGTNACVGIHLWCVQNSPQANSYNLLSCIHVLQRTILKTKNPILDKLRAIHETHTRCSRPAR